MKRKSKYTINVLQDLVKTSTSYRQILFKLDLKEGGGSYSYIQFKIKELKLDTSHFTGKIWNKGKVDCDLLKKQMTKNSNIRPSNLKNKLFNAGLKKKMCESCKKKKWKGVIIPLELHHIDGDNTNNLFSNLQILCPNCHALTPNYRGRNV